MRYIRYAFWAVLGVVLISVAIANRDDVTLNLFPEAIADLVGLNQSITLPLYAVILAGIAAGLLIGFVWEWLREHKHRSAKSRTQKELKQAQREMRRLKGRDGEKQDEVIALLE